MEERVYEKYLKAGEIARNALKIALDIVEEDYPLLKIAEKIEEYIISRGAKPAFPVNISINHIAAHFSPPMDNEETIPRGGVVKIDVGVHVQGYIADSALTISFDRKWDKLILASKEALREAIEILRDGISMNDVGKVISKTIKEYGLKPIVNLSGHMIDKYSLHAGKNVPNVPSLEHKFKKMRKDEVYAIEPFATNGRGYVIDNGPSHIYRVVSTKRIKRERKLSDTLRDLWREFYTLPFSERWVIKYSLCDYNSLQRLVNLRRIYHYPMLVESGRGYVSQFEDTVIIRRREAIPVVGVLDLL